MMSIKRLLVGILIVLVILTCTEAYWLWKKQIEIRRYEAETVDLFFSCISRALRSINGYGTLDNKRDMNTAYELLLTAQMVLRRYVCLLWGICLVVLPVFTGD